MISDIHLLIGSALFLIVVSLIYLAMPALIRFLQSSQMLDKQNERSSHLGEVPRGGGLLIVVAMCIAAAILAVASSQTSFYLALLCLLLAWASLSWLDDRMDLHAGTRFAVQFCLAGLTVWAFGWISMIQSLHLGWIGVGMSVCGIVWMANLYNFMDGIDGLAASQAIVAALTLACWFGFLNNNNMAAICLVVAGASYGFLLWNWQPAKVFMGDVGSISLGAFFATAMIIAVTRHQIPVLSLIALFGVFVFDATATFLKRLLKGEKVWQAHRQHLYQRAVILGVSHAKVTLVAVALMFVSALFATLSLRYNQVQFGLLLAQAIIYVFLTLCIKRLERRDGHKAH